jgi:hypothetical protein
LKVCIVGDQTLSVVSNQPEVAIQLAPLLLEPLLVLALLLIHSFLLFRSLPLPKAKPFFVDVERLAVRL